MRCLIVVFLFILVSFIQGCSVEPTDLSSVRAGSDQIQIESLLGEPIDVMQTSEGEVRSYEYDKGSEKLESLTPFWDGRSLGGCVGGCAMAGLGALPLEILTYPYRRSEQIDDQKGVISILYDKNGEVALEAYGPNPKENVSTILESLERERKLLELKRQALNGTAEAQYQIARRFTNSKEKRTWLKRAASQGHDKAILGLAQWVGMPDVWSLYCKAAAGGHVYAAATIALRYKYGNEPVIANKFKSYYWYKIAEVNGYEPPNKMTAGELLGMSASEVLEVEKHLINSPPSSEECEKDGLASKQF